VEVLFEPPVNELGSTFTCPDGPVGTSWAQSKDPHKITATVTANILADSFIVVYPPGKNSD